MPTIHRNTGGVPVCVASPSSRCSPCWRQAASSSRRRPPSAASPAPASRPETGDEWPRHGLDAAETRFSPLSAISADNVGRLGLAWHFRFDRPRGVEATPIMVDGTLYVSGPWGVVYAVDARNGQLKWQHDPEVPAGKGMHACCDVVNRGVAVDDGRVFVATIDGRLQALDAQSGRLLWSMRTFAIDAPYTITGAPRVARGLVIIGNGGAEYGVRGFVSAYDAQTGELRWRFYTVPGNPADGPDGTISDRRCRTSHCRPGAANGGATVVAAPSGTRWPGIRNWTSFTSASATARRTTAMSAVPAVATICSCPRSSRSAAPPASTCGTTRPRRATAGTTPPPST
ncbi:PQQ-binding-like beta-propeller repeat protein [Thauera humireducens]|uniref:outer membrane protein assembly factor BamB family protein n=1 Tax=Thauera humireducens TaxID=1134435 RepID=UPI00311DF6B1